MIIIVDSREHRPFHFSPEIETEVAALAAGDYSIKGMETEIAIERKSLEDLLGSITSGRDRFIRELRQLRSYRFAAIIVEGSWAQIEMKQYRANVHPNAVIGSLLSFAVRYNVVPVLAENHDMASQICERLLTNFARVIEDDFKKLKTASKTALEARSGTKAAEGASNITKSAEAVSARAN